jgi:hypothetical protein
LRSRPHTTRGFVAPCVAAGPRRRTATEKFKTTTFEFFRCVPKGLALARAAAPGRSMGNMRSHAVRPAKVGTKRPKPALPSTITGRSWNGPTSTIRLAARTINGRNFFPKRIQACGASLIALQAGTQTGMLKADHP